MSDDYTVGYGKPPKDTQFKPGHSGNRKGRPKGARGLKSDLREEMAERVTINENGKSKKISKQRLMVKSMAQKAAKGDVRAQSAILELVMRVFGIEGENSGKAKLSTTDQAIFDAFVVEADSGSVTVNTETDDVPEPAAGGSGDIGGGNVDPVAADDEEPDDGDDD